MFVVVVCSMLSYCVLVFGCCCVLVLCCADCVLCVICSVVSRIVCCLFVLDFRLSSVFVLCVLFVVRVSCFILMCNLIVYFALAFGDRMSLVGFMFGLFDCHALYFVPSASN